MTDGIFERLTDLEREEMRLTDLERHLLSEHREVEETDLFQIFVKTLSDKTVTFEVSSNGTISQVKIMIEDRRFGCFTLTVLLYIDTF